MALTHYLVAIFTLVVAPTILTTASPVRQLRQSSEIGDCDEGFSDACALREQLRHDVYLYRDLTVNVTMMQVNSILNFILNVEQVRSACNVAMYSRKLIEKFNSSESGNETESVSIVAAQQIRSNTCQYIQDNFFTNPPQCECDEVRFDTFCLFVTANERSANFYQIIGPTTINRDRYGWINNLTEVCPEVKDYLIGRVNSRSF